MKKLVYKNKFGENPRKREVSIEEISTRTKMRIVKRWRCKYFVNEEYTSDNLESLKGWIESKRENGILRNCHMLKRTDTRTRENKIFCKVIGDFYVISGNTAYRIIYVNEIKIHIAGKDEDRKKEVKDEYIIE